MTKCRRAPDRTQPIFDLIENPDDAIVAALRLERALFLFALHGLKGEDSQLLDNPEEDRCGEWRQ
jgi:hypothetical protein